jgi:DNA-binding CsgD family transcriptional regulator
MLIETAEPNPQSVAPLLESLGTGQFGTGLFRFVAKHIPIAVCTAFYFPEAGQPALVVDESEGPRGQGLRAATEQYLQGFFSRDANFLSLTDALRGRPSAARCMHRDTITDPAYRAKFYDDVDIQEKFSFVARVNLGTIYVNMYRAAQEARFQPDELIALRQMSAVCISAVRKHLALMPPPLKPSTRNRGDRLQLIHQLLMNQRSHCLTPREAQICAHVVLGYSSSAIASTLGLAESTVGTFRKRAYARLGIASQSELFAICLEAVDRNSRDA